MYISKKCLSICALASSMITAEVATTPELTVVGRPFVGPCAPVLPLRPCAPVLPLVRPCTPVLPLRPVLPLVRPCAPVLPLRPCARFHFLRRPCARVGCVGIEQEAVPEKEVATIEVNSQNYPNEMEYNHGRRHGGHQRHRHGYRHGRRHHGGHYRYRGHGGGRRHH